MGKKSNVKRVTDSRSIGKAEGKFTFGSEGRFISLIMAFIIAVVTFYSFSPALDAGFLNIDDERFISENEMITEGSLTDLGPVFKRQLFSPHYKPLVYYSWILEKELFGMDPYHYHLDNILLHIACSLILFLLLKMLISYFSPVREHSLAIAFAVTLLFAIHPLRVESVAWAVERKDVLFALFYFIGLWAYLKYLKNELRPVWIFVAATCYLLCMLSKSMGITLIAVVFLIDYIANRKFSKRLFLEKIPLFIVAGIGVIVFGLIIKFDAISIGVTEGILSAEQTVIEPAVFSGLPAWYKQVLSVNYRYLFFILHMLIPVKLAIVYPRAHLLDLAGAAIHILPVVNAALFLTLYFFRKRIPYVVFGLVFYSIAIFPALVMGDKGTNFLSDRYMYIPSIGITLVVVVAGFLLLKRYFPEKKKGFLLPFVIVAIPLILLTNRYTKVWKDNESLYSDAISKYPGMLELAYQNRAKDRRERQLYDAALGDYKVLLSMGAEDASMFGSIANIYGVKNDFDNALKYYSKSIANDPAYATSYVNRGITYAKMNRLDQAISDFEIAHSLDTTQKGLYEMWGRASQQRGEHAKAIELFSYAIHRFENASRYYFSRGLSRFNIGRYQAALADFHEVIKKEPAHKEATNNISACYYNLEDYGKAMEYALKAQSLGYPVGSAYMENIRTRQSK